MTRRFFKSKRGFTLIELLVVIAIIGVLASIVLASLNTARRKGRDTRRIADLGQVRLALELYFDTGTNRSYPAAGTWADLTTAISGATSCGSAPCMQQVPVDPINSGTNVYGYQGVDSAGAACSAACTSVSYVIRAILEDTGNPALLTDIDGTVAGVDCTSGTPETAYCQRP